MASKKNHVVLILFFITGLLTYANSLQNDFALDDHHTFKLEQQNPRSFFKHLLPHKDALMEPEGEYYYRPIMHAMYFASYVMFKDNPFWYHLVNFVLLCLAAYLIYIFFGRFLKDQELGLMVGLFYLVHPVNAVLINLLTANYLILEVIMMILSLMYFLMATEERKGWRFYGASLLFFGAALLLHETAVVFPLYLLAVLLTFKKEDSSWLDEIKRASLKVAPFIAVLAGYILLRMCNENVGNIFSVKFSRSAMDLPEYLASLTQLIGWYLGKLIVPVGIVLTWVSPVVHQDPFLWVFVLLISLGIFVYLLVHYARTEQKAIVLGLSWLFIGFIPFSLGSLLQTHGLMIEPHWFVFSSIGFFLIVASLIKKIEAGWRPFRVICIVSFVAAWIFGSLSINRIWSDERIYCQMWLREVPEYKPAHFFLARAYLSKKELGPARFHYEHALSEQYSDRIIYTNLGMIGLLDGNLEEAKKDLLGALKIDPDLTTALNTLGVIYVKQNDIAKAKEYFLRSIKADEMSLPARINLFKVLLKEGNKSEAEKVYKEILMLKRGK